MYRSKDKQDAIALRGRKGRCKTVTISRDGIISSSNRKLEALAIAYAKGYMVYSVPLQRMVIRSGGRLPNVVYKYAE
jgi:hypothetical protein